MRPPSFEPSSTYWTPQDRGPSSAGHGHAVCRPRERPGREGRFPPATAFAASSRSTGSSGRSPVPGRGRCARVGGEEPAVVCARGPGRRRRRRRRPSGNGESAVASRRWKRASSVKRTFWRANPPWPGKYARIATYPRLAAIHRRFWTLWSPIAVQPVGEPRERPFEPRAVAPPRRSLCHAPQKQVPGRRGAADGDCALPSTTPSRSTSSPMNRASRSRFGRWSWTRSWRSRRSFVRA